MKKNIISILLLTLAFMGSCFAAEYTFTDSYGEKGSITIPDQIEMFTSSDKMKSSIIRYGGIVNYAMVGRIGQKSYLGKIQFDENADFVDFVVYVGEWNHSSYKCNGNLVGAIVMNHWSDPSKQTHYCFD